MPEVPDYLSHFWEAFIRLSRRRVNTGFAVSGIPYSDIVAWMDEEGYETEEERDAFVSIIDELDGTYIQFLHDKSKEDKK